jgi:spore protease
MKYFGRTDLAVEENEYCSYRGSVLSHGVINNSHVNFGFHTISIKIVDKYGEEQLHKPMGNYITIELDKFIRRESNSFEDGVMAFSTEFSKLANLGENDNILVVGLGNSFITPDAIGHFTLKYTLATRHLKNQYGDTFSSFREVSLLEPGVLGTTGIESFDIIRSVVETVKPNIVVAVDALASRSVKRICRTIQISDTGIIPGSGIGNPRGELSVKTLGVPVIAVGVPTVVDVSSILSEFCEEANVECDESIIREQEGSMIVTPKDIDSAISDISRLIGYGLNMALHKNLSISDIDMFVG